LRQQLVRSRHERALEVIKFRGASVLYGAHTFRIGDDGIEMFPQLEALPVAPLAPGISRGRVGSGVPGLDEMLGGGGYPAGSVTAISGQCGEKGCAALFKGGHRHNRREAVKCSGNCVDSV